MSHVLLLFANSQAVDSDLQLQNSNTITISSGYQILYYDTQINDNENEKEVKESANVSSSSASSDYYKCALLGIPVEISQDVMISSCWLTH